MNAGSPPRAWHTVHARVGLVGNPSDGFGGAVLATPVPSLQARVLAVPSDEVVIAGPGVAETWPSLRPWRERFTAGTGTQRIITAALWSLDEHVRRSAVDCANGAGVTITWDTDVPKSVGLAGSSALAVGVIDAVASSWGLGLDRRVCAALALHAERDVLGIAAGWQDRIVQAFGCTVLVDASEMEEVDGVAVPVVHELIRAQRAGRSLELVVGWKNTAAASSHDYHGPLRADPARLAGPMGELAALARSAAASFERGDDAALAAAADAGWLIRQSCVPLRADHAELVESVRAMGVAATTPGSGGSVVAACRDHDAADEVCNELQRIGCTCVRWTMPAR